MTNPFRVLASLAAWAVLATLVAACGGAPGGAGGVSEGPQPADTTPPAVVSKLPTEDQELVDRASAIVVTFSEALDPTTVTSTNVLLRRTSAGDVPRVVTWDPLSNTVYIKKPATVVTPFLEADTQYKVTLTRGLKDKAGNELPEQVEWSFTTGTTIDHEPPVWQSLAAVTAEAVRFDAVMVSWTPATDNVTPADKLVYVVSYKLVSESDASFSTKTSGSGATSLEVTGLSPGKVYEFRVQVRDLAEYLSEFLIAAGSVTLPPAGRLYAANFLSNAVSSIPEIGTVTGDRVGTQVFSANETGLSNPIGVAVNARSVTLKDPASCTPPATSCPAPSMLYVSNWSANSITAYENPETLGQYQPPNRINAKPAWTLKGLETGLAEPAALWVSTEIVDGRTREILYVANMRGMSRTLFGLQPVGNILAFDVTREDGRRTGAPQDESGNIPPFGIIKSPWFVTPMAFAVDKSRRRLYVANRDKVYSENGVFDQAGTQILAFEIPPDASDGSQSGLYRLMNPSLGDPDPFRYTIQGFCSDTVSCSLLGPTGIALDEENDRLYVANRGQNNLVVIENASSAGGAHTTRIIEGEGAGLVIADHPNPDLKNASPNAVWFDPTTRRLFATTRNAQSVLVFDVSNTVMNTTLIDGQRVVGTLVNGRLVNGTFVEGTFVVGTLNGTEVVGPLAEGPLAPQLAPIRVIRGSRTGLGQPTGQIDAFRNSQQSAGPFGITVTTVVTVVTDATTGTSTTSKASTAYVASFGLHAIPVFDVSPDPVKDALPANTPPNRLLMGPMQGLTGAALDRVSDPLNDRLYVAAFHSNLILVYDKASDLTGTHLLPNRIIGGPATKLDHPVHLVFNPATPDRTAALFVANQSGHSVLVFGGELKSKPTPQDVGTLEGDVAPSRLIGAPEGTEFTLDTPVSQCTDPLNQPADVNCTELAYPTGIALDEERGVLYVSNRDAAAFEDFAGRKILAFKDASLVDGNVSPTWKIEGHPPPAPGFNQVVTDETTLQRPAALFYDPALDRLYVANRGRKSILVFTDISKTVQAPPLPLNYNVAPAWTITNANLYAPTGFAGYAPNGSLRELYVADASISAILAFKVDALDPDVPLPTLTPRIIVGASLGLRQPFGLALDPSK